MGSVGRFTNTIVIHDNWSRIIIRNLPTRIHIVNYINKIKVNIYFRVAQSDLELD